MNSSIRKDREGGSVLSSLRDLLPPRPLTFTEALRLAELQANDLLRLTDIDSAPVPSGIVSELPHLLVHPIIGLPVSGSSFWDGSCWIIELNAAEPWYRQRFTLMHEFWHILWRDHELRTYPPGDGARRREQTADFFAGCVLMPKRLLKRAWGEGVQAPGDLATRFGVSVPAAQVRLAQLGLSEPTRRCLPPGEQRPVLAPDRCYRQRSSPWTTSAQPLEVA